jgi:hypothetical protein
VSGTGLVTITSSAIPIVPESSTWAMMLLGFGGLCFAACRWRRQQAKVFPRRAGLA